MTTALVLIALMAVVCLTTLIGGVLFLIGLFRKKRAFKRMGALLGVASIFVLAGCLIYASAKVFNKLKSTNPQKIWEATVNAAFDDTAIRPSDPAQAKQILSGKLGKTNFLERANVQGVWVDAAFLSYGYFLYVADEKELLSAVATAPVDPSFQLISDEICKEASWAECEDSLMYPKGPQRNLPGWTPEAVVEKRCYRCLRCPWSHTILIDGKTGQVYHSISEIRE
ncbi:MAG: hypothetical protein HY298_00345 [Verrucomicrobia bacterium]|nr:hypothetical protein [Verrucomicrobiota bacterium]